MEEQLVSFDTAKLAKEKGFHRNIKGGDRYEADGTISQNGFWSYNTSAPTQSLLQKWLRDTHNLQIEIMAYDDLDDENKYVYDYLIVYKLMADEDECDSEPEFTTYEEALEVALFESLKFIPSNEK